jgi:putative hemolysin
LIVFDPALAVAVLACAMGGYFATCNIALKTFSRSRLTELLELRGNAEKVPSFAARSEALQLVTGTIRTCLNLVVLLATLYAFEDRTTWPAPWQYFAALVVTGVAVSVFVVAIPASWARYRPEQVLARAMPVLTVCLVIFTPIAKALGLLDPIVRRVSGADVEEEEDDVEKVTSDVMSVVEDHQSNGKVDRAQRDMIEAVFEFPSIMAAEIMTPRTETEGLELDATLAQVKDYVLEKGHSRVPVYEEDLDHIVGILYIKDLIRFLDDADGPTFDLRQVMREPWMVPETKPVRELLGEFKARKVHMAILLDEYGGTAGLITIEDIIEELVGEIQDEYEPGEAEPTISKLDDRIAEVDARVYVNDLNDQLGLDLPEDEDYDTLGGFVFAKLGHIPETGESFVYENLELTITYAERTKVKRVRLEQQAEQESSPESGVQSPESGVQHRGKGPN